MNRVPKSLQVLSIATTSSASAMVMAHVIKQHTLGAEAYNQTLDGRDVFNQH